jgi:hypothetical protein
MNKLLVWYGELKTQQNLAKKGVVFLGAGILWLMLFLILPGLVLVVVSFISRGAYGQLEWTFTFENYKWLNWILEPEVGANISNFVQFATPNKASMPYINKEDRNNPAIYPSPEVMKKLFYLKDPGANMKLLDQAWTRIKAN